MGKRIGMGVVWAVVLYIGGWVVTATIISAMAHMRDPENGQEIAIEYTLQFVVTYRITLFLGSITLATVGTALGWLPGTEAEEKRRRPAGAGRPRMRVPRDVPEI